jgi:protein-S-isoprenylcysteine O-methyltransferase Ste14
MSLVPAFQIGLLNAWIFIIPYLLMNFGLTPLFINRKSTFWAWPSYTGLERTYLLAGMVLMGGMWIYSIFLPLNLGTPWFYTGLAVYLVGWAFLILAMLVFTKSPVDKPNTGSVYRISRHPWYIGMFLVYIGTGIASSSWVYILVSLILLATYRTAFMIPEERMCCEKFGDMYREYMNRTPRWIGLLKS